jgi:DNA-binding beta-propeller fold protein YncE
MRLGGSLSLAVALGALGALAGCGSETVHELPPAAEPPRSPTAERVPAGMVTEVGSSPEGVVADAATGMIAVALRDPARLALVDGATGTVRRRVSLPGAARHLALARPGGPVLVPAEPADRLLEVSLPDGAVRRRVRVGAQPHDVAAAGAAVLVGDERGNTLSAVRGSRVVAAARVATQPGGVAALKGGAQVAVVSVRERRLELYDTRTLRRIGRAPAGIGPTHVACLDRGPCYVADTRDNALLVYSVGAGVDPTRRYALPGSPYGIALDRARRRLFVTLPARNELVELVAHGRPHVVRRWPTVRQPDSVAVDERTGDVFVTGRVDGVLERVTP